MIQSGLLIPDGQKGVACRYKWNMKDFGPVSLLIADMMIAETENQVRIAAKSRYYNRKKRRNNNERKRLDKG